MTKFLKQIVFLLIYVYLVSCSQVADNRNSEYENVYQCGAEKINSKKWRFLEKDSLDFWFGNVEAQTSETSFSGNHSLKLTPEKQFGFTTELENTGPDEFIAVEVWRKNENKNGVIVIDGGNGFYNAGNQVVEEKDGWQKIYLEAFTPPTFFNQKVKVFVWNNSSDSVYFDDLKITRRNKKKYPEYSEIPGMQIHADQPDLQHFHQKRISAFETSVLVNSDEDYADVVLFDGSDFLNGQFRLKGDLVDHIQGQKWSFRIKLKKEFAWKNMRTFSVQNPATRSFLHEWLAHQIFLNEDVLTTRYGFVPVSLNNESLGIYAWEEHFDKHLVESQNRREGPVIRFDESLFWERVLETNKTKREWDVDFFGGAKIIPFKEGRTSQDSLLNKQLVEAQKLMLQYKNLSTPVSEIFDIKKLAKYYALIDITQAYHGFTWHNQRFYYNPVTCLLEPIAFDGYIEGGIYRRFDEQVSGLLNPQKLQNFKKEESLLFYVFADSEFQKNYLENLNKYSRSAFIQNLVSAYKPKTDSLAVLLKKEFPAYEFNYNYMKWQAEYIQKHFDEIEKNVYELGDAVKKISINKFQHTFTSDLNHKLIPWLVHVYFNQNKKQIEVLNFHNSAVKLLGVFNKNGPPESFEENIFMGAYQGLFPEKIQIPVSATPVKLLFEVDGEMLETEISHWAYSEEKSVRQKILLNPLPSNILVENGKIILKGKYSFTEDIVIPDSIKVFASPGTSIDLLEGSSFISFSAVNFEGTRENPIKIYSSDNSANAFNVLQAREKSNLKHVEFSGLSNLKKGGWQTPSAVTFYESDADFINCTFRNNSNCDDALNLVRSHFYLAECIFENTFADAFDSDFCTGEVVNSTFTNTGNDAIDFSGSNVSISNCTMTDIGDKAISGGENSKLNVTNCQINKANIGIAAKDLSVLRLEKITMNTTVYGIVAFVKKPEYGPASVYINDLINKKNMVFHQIEVGSKLVLNGKIIHGKEKKLALKLYQ